MRRPATKFVALNAAAALIGVAALVAAAHSILVSPAAAPCSERYHSMTQFVLEREGAVLAAAELQASLNGRDVGVIENVAVTPVENAPQRIAMSVLLPTTRVAARASAPSPSGASFPWEPRVVQGKVSACLGFHVLLSADFDFGRGGALPGLAGGDAAGGGDRFLARLAWRPKGVGGATVHVTENGVTRALPAELEGFEFPRGKWLKVEQEVVLNAPGKNDGALRVWVDGALVIDRTDMGYRAKAETAISGVAVDVFYGSGPDDAKAAPPNEARVWLTPFELRWP
jgi:hypothetical protein